MRIYEGQKTGDKADVGKEKQDLLNKTKPDTNIYSTEPHKQIKTPDQYLLIGVLLCHIITSLSHAVRAQPQGNCKYNDS